MKHFCTAPLSIAESINFYFLRKLSKSNFSLACMKLYQSKIIAPTVELATSKAVKDYGIVNFDKCDPSRSILIIINHLSYFDGSSVFFRLFKRFRKEQRVFFFARSEGIYDSFWGGFLNILLTGGIMYPPVLRDKRSRDWSPIALSIGEELLKDRRTILGIHPEGGRSKTKDPYDIKTMQPGAARLIYRCQPNVLPVYIQGFPKNPLKLLFSNLKRNSTPMVNMIIGEPIDFGTELAMPNSQTTILKISHKMREALVSLMDIERSLHHNNQNNLSNLEIKTGANI